MDSGPEGGTGAPDRRRPSADRSDPRSIGRYGAGRMGEPGGANPAVIVGRIVRAARHRPRVGPAAHAAAHRADGGGVDAVVDQRRSVEGVGGARSRGSGRVCGGPRTAVECSPGFHRSGDGSPGRVLPRALAGARVDGEADAKRRGPRGVGGGSLLRLGTGRGGAGGAAGRAGAALRGSGQASAPSAGVRAAGPHAPVGRMDRSGVGGVWLVVAVLLLRRVSAVLLLKPLVGQIPRWDEALFIGWFGPMGVGALYFAAVAEKETGLPQVWSVTTLLVAISIVVHDVTATPLSIWLAGCRRLDPDGPQGG